MSTANKLMTKVMLMTMMKMIMIMMATMMMIMVGDLLVVVSGQRETTALKLIAIHLAEIENWGRC